MVAKLLGAFALFAFCVTALGCVQLRSCETKGNAAAAAWDLASEKACQASKKAKDKMGIGVSNKSPWMPASRLYLLRESAQNWNSLCDDCKKIAAAYEKGTTKNQMEIFSLEETARGKVAKLEKENVEESAFFILVKKALDTSIEAASACRGR